MSRWYILLHSLKIDNVAPARFILHQRPANVCIIVLHDAPDVTNVGMIKIIMKRKYLHKLYLPNGLLNHYLRNDNI